MADPITLVPFVPGGADFGKSRELFRALGFQEEWSNGGYAGFRSGGAKFILQDFNEPSFASNLMIKIEVPREIEFEKLTQRQQEINEQSIRQHRA